MAQKRLREYAAREKKRSPEFRDLGETRASKDGAREYKIECRFAGLSAVGTAPEKHIAKEIAADKMLSIVSKK